MMAPGQKERCLFSLRVLVFPADNHVRVIPLGSMSEGVSQGGGRVPSLRSSFAEERSQRSQGAWPCDAMSAMTSEI